MQGSSDNAPEDVGTDTRRRPYWRNKGAREGAQDAHEQDSGVGENMSANGSKARRARPQQAGAGQAGGGEPSSRGGDAPRRGTHPAAKALQELQGARAQRPGPAVAVAVAAPPPGLSLAGAAPPAQPQRHPYRLGQADAAHAVAAPQVSSSSRQPGDGQGRRGGGRASHQQQAQPPPPQPRQAQKQQRVTGAGAPPGFVTGGQLSVEQSRGPAGGGGTRGRGAQGGKAAGRALAVAAAGMAAGGRGGRGGRGGGPVPQYGAGAPGVQASGAGGRRGAPPPPPLGAAAAAAYGGRGGGMRQPGPAGQPAQRFGNGGTGGGGGRRAIFAEHLSQSDLQRGLKSGHLFRALFRCNAADRTQGFCTVAGLRSDVFIKGYKAQNRAMEGDEVVIRVLPPDQWYQLTSTKQAQQGQQQQAAPAAPAAAAASNVVPAAGLAARARAGAEAAGAAAAPPAAESEAGVAPPAWSGAAPPPVGLGGLVASPALHPSTSGGELSFSLGPAPLRMEGASSESEEGSEVEEGLSEEEAEAVLEELEDRMQGMSLLGIGTMQEATGSTAAGSAAASPSDGSPAPSSPAAAEAAGAEPPAAEPPAAPAAGEPAACAAAAAQSPPDGAGQEDGVGTSMLDFVLSQAGKAGPVAAARAAPAGPAAGAAVTNGGCWHATEDPEESIKAVAAMLGEKPGWRATGEVVAVVQPSRRRESVIGVLKQEGDSDNGVLLLFPCDPRLPRMLVRSAQLPSGLKQALKQEACAAELSARTLVSAHVAGWEACHMFPLAQVRESLGQAGELASETRALLEMEQVTDDDQFTPGVLACLPPTPWSISEEEMAQRRDFRDTRLFSIDPPTARDLDDALSVEELGGGLYRVGVHIADVSHFVRPGSALDKEAQQRSTSVYLVDRVIPMLPRLLCEELCSLNPGVDRLAFSIVWDMTEEGDIRSTWVGRSVIRSCGKLAYPMVQSMIEGQYLAREGEEPPCDLHGPHTWPQVVGDSLALHRIALNLRRRRFEGGALRLDNVKLYFHLDEQGNPDSYSVYEQKEANQLVEEFMLLANMTAARMVADAFPDRALLRCHPPPNQHKLLELAVVARDLGFTLDVSSAGALQDSLTALRAQAGGDTIIDIITLLATKPMQVARYFCTGETPDKSYWRHYALAVSHYTHFTSPIRRYPDIIVHRLLAAAIDTHGSIDERMQRHGLLEAREAGMVSSHANDRKMAAKSVQDGSLRLYLCVMLHRQPFICDGVVMAVAGARFFDVYIPALGVDVRVHTNSVLKGAEGAVSSVWDAENKVLTLGRAHDMPPEQRTPEDLPEYASEVPNFDKVQNPEGIPPAPLPLTLRMLSHVPVVVSSRRSQTSGSPTHVFAKLWVE